LRQVCAVQLWEISAVFYAKKGRIDITHEVSEGQ